MRFHENSNSVNEIWKNISSQQISSKKKIQTLRVNKIAVMKFFKNMSYGIEFKLQDLPLTYKIHNFIWEVRSYL